MNQPLPPNHFRAQLHRNPGTHVWQLSYSLNGHIKSLAFEQKLDESPFELSTRMQDELAKTIAHDMLCEAFEQVWRG